MLLLKQSSSSIVLIAAVNIIVLFGGCDLNKKNPNAYLDEALSKAPDAFFERALVGPQNDGTYIVATTQRIDPAGENIIFLGRPVDLALNPDETILAVKNMKDMVFMDAVSGEIFQTLKYQKAEIPSQESYGAIMARKYGRQTPKASCVLQKSRRTEALIGKMKY